MIVLRGEEGDGGDDLSLIADVDQSLGIGAYLGQSGYYDTKSTAW